MQACEAIKILSGHREAISRKWTIISLWDNTIRQLDVSSLHAVSYEGVSYEGASSAGVSSTGGGCPACRGEYPWLTGQRGSHTAILCGRNAV
jgi:adenylyltransferase/sulfurtransferase